MMRRCLLRALAGMMLAAVSVAAAQAQSWPDKTVKLILPYAPGGATDLIGRPWADKLSQAFGQQFVIENRGGAGGMIGTEAAAKAAARRLYLSAQPMRPPSPCFPICAQAPYDTFKSFDPVARVGDLVTGFVIHPAVGVKNFKEMVEYAKKNPGKLAYGSAGLATSTHLRIEMLKYRAGIDILHVPYRGSADALNDLLPNNVQMMNEINVLPHVKAGKLDPPQYQSSHAPPGFSGRADADRARLSGFRRADRLHDPGAGGHAQGRHRQAQRQDRRDRRHRRYEGQDARDQRGRAAAIPEELTAFLKEDSKRNAEVIKAANIKLE